MPIQGAWSSWEGVQQKKLSWRNLFDTSPKLLQFMIGSTYDTVASPANLKRWGLSEDDACKLCQQKATTTHILAGLPDRSPTRPVHLASQPCAAGYHRGCFEDEVIRTQSKADPNTSILYPFRQGRRGYKRFRQKVYRKAEDLP